MIHPVIDIKNGKIAFVVWWITVFVIHFSILFYFYNIPVLFSFVDSLVFITLFLILSLGIWFWVRVSDISTIKPVSLVTNHLGAVALSVTIIVSFHSYILSLIFPDELSYINFLDSSMLGRIITGSFLYLVITLIYYLYIYVQNFREKVTAEAELKSLIKEAELNWLKLQINPHFLFNSLNSISSLTLTSPLKAQDMIIKLSELLRYSLNQSPDKMVTLETEVDNCIKYLEIEKVRFGERLIYEIEIPHNCIDVKVPSMIFQPLFENAVKHSVAQSVNSSRIDVVASKDIHGVTITVTNTLPADSISPHGTGVGLDNIRRRLRLIYGTPNLLSANKLNDSYKVCILIPFENSII